MRRPRYPSAMTQPRVDESPEGGEDAREKAQSTKAERTHFQMRLTVYMSRLNIYHAHKDRFLPLTLIEGFIPCKDEKPV